ncbi:MAG: GNAT family N-acetyltransferase [Lachnospiraceae bacterium]|nr:GNAT family N-acetyltransferase [Lachnospiraceae bacterium]
MKEQAYEINRIKKEEMHIVSEMLFDSEIGKKYYPSKAVLDGILADGYGKDLFYLIKTDEGAVGFIWFQQSGAFYMYPYLHMVFVKEEYRKSGYGRKLLQFFEEYSLNDGEKKKIKNKVFLLVGNWNQGAMAFYKRLGYTEVGVLPGLFRKRIDEHLFMKECIGV